MFYKLLQLISQIDYIFISASISSKDIENDTDLWKFNQTEFQSNMLRDLVLVDLKSKRKTNADLNLFDLVGEEEIQIQFPEVYFSQFCDQTNNENPNSLQTFKELPLTTQNLIVKSILFVFNLVSNH